MPEWGDGTLRNGVPAATGRSGLGYDSTTESAVTKLMFLLGHGYTPDEVRDRMNRSIAGEITL